MKNKISDEYFMRLAMARARQGIRKGQTPFGACIVKKRKMIASGHNIVWKTMDITAHAEIHTIQLACRKLKTIDLSGCVIYSTCEPCPMCLSACHWARIKRIVYGARISDARKAGFNELLISNSQMVRLGQSRVKVEGDFLREENRELFKEWAQQALLPARQARLSASASLRRDGSSRRRGREKFTRGEHGEY